MIRSFTKILCPSRCDKDVMDLSDLHSRVDRAATNCPGGLGNFGFNSYDLMTFGLLVMGAVTGVSFHF